MLKYAQLLHHFDVEKLKAEVRQLDAPHWKPHYNSSHYEGNWTVLPLRSLNGETGNILSVHAAGNGVSHYADTVLLDACRYIRTLLAFFSCEKTSVRLMKLHAGASIKEHRDTGLRFEDGEARLHIPVITNPQVSFFLDEELLHLAEGECRYLNLSLRHSVCNDSPSDRIHLVIDCVVNDWLHQLLTRQTEKQKHMEAETVPHYDLATQLNIIAELRRLNTSASRELAAKMERELS